MKLLLSTHELRDIHQLMGSSRVFHLDKIINLPVGITQVN